MTKDEQCKLLEKINGDVIKLVDKYESTYHERAIVDKIADIIFSEEIKNEKL